MPEVSDWNVFIDLNDGWILSHIYLLAMLYIYTRNPWLVFTLIYVWESIELTLTYMGATALEEDIVDTLIIDPISALIGVLLAHPVVVSRTAVPVDLGFKIAHLLVITASSFACLAEEEWIGFLVFTLVYSGTTYLMSLKYSGAGLMDWAIISGSSMAITAGIVLAIGKAAPIVAFIVPLAVVIPSFLWLSQDPLAEEPKRSVSQSVTLGEWRP